MPDKISSARWLEIDIKPHRFLITRIADASHIPSSGFEGKIELGKAGGNHMLFYIFLANADRNSVFILNGKPLPKPRLINRMPGSAASSWFIASPDSLGELNAGGYPVSLAAQAQRIQQLPLFWNADPEPAIAYADLPGWLEESGPPR